MCLASGRPTLGAKRLIAPGLVGATASALAARRGLLERLHAESTDCYRVLHGVAEGADGVTVDRYGPLLLVQTTSQARVPTDELEALKDLVAGEIGAPLELVHRRRGVRRHGPALRGHAGRSEATRPRPDARIGAVGHEMGIAYDVSLLPNRPDPLLYLDLRAGRRRLAEASRGLTVLNLFAYTCTAGVCAAASGAVDVWNVDWSRTALEIGRANAQRNGIAPERFRLLREDFHPAARQLAGLPVKGRAARSRQYLRLDARTFDIVVLDPPPWSVGPHGAVDVVRDYESLFKPALLATAPGGRLLATNHAPDVDRLQWRDRLLRCAQKAGRRIAAAEWVLPERDFPAPDGLVPMAMLWLGVCS